MIKELKQTNAKEILEYCYNNERENFFTINNIENRKDSFKNLKVIAKYRNKKIIGLLTFFKDYKNLVAHSEDPNAIKELVDNFEDKESIKFVVCYKKYADIILEYLKEAYNLKPKESRIEDVFELSKESFKDFSKIDSDYRKAQTKQKQEIAEFATKIDKEPIEDAQPELIRPENEYLLYIDNQLIARAALHGKTQNYFQIGGVGTLENHRRKGYSKQIVSHLCKTNLTNRRKGLLFTGENNIAAQSVYKKIGFKKFDKVILAKF